MKINTNPPKGMRDLTPQEVVLRNYIRETILEVYQRFGFSQIVTPVMDDISILTSGQGGENEKLIFKILKRGEKLRLQKENLTENHLVDFGMRFDLTVPLTRFYANNRAKLPNPFKVIQIGSSFRAERPQKGRFRQFIQCDIDIIGNPNVTAETELILATTQALQKLDFKDFKVRINDRRILEHLAEYCGFETKDFGKVFIILDKLDKINLSGVQKELEQENFSIESIQKLTQIIESVTSKKLDFELITEILPQVDSQWVEDLKFIAQTVKAQSQDFEIVYDLTLVRGMGYYTGVILEIEMPEFGSSVAGGGRYDKMVGRFLKNQDVPACGFSIGFERIVQILEDKGFQPPKKGEKIAFLYDGKKESFQQILPKVQELRAEGKTVSIEVKRKKMKKQLDDFKQFGFDKFCIFRLNEPLEIKDLD